jgi:hypothetical protein
VESQQIDSLPTENDFNNGRKLSERGMTSKSTKPEIFSSGFLDVMNNGQVNASARFIRIYIGEPGKFAIPLSLYSGVSANNFQNPNSSTGMVRSNEQLVNQYINPLSGLLNISADGIIYFRKTRSLTKAGWSYHLGERVLTGFRAGLVTSTQAGRPVSFLNSYAASGFYFQTGAWERSNTNNMGICWLAVRYHLSYSNPAEIRDFLPAIYTNGLYTGYSLGFGVDISSLVNIKVIYYKYLKRPEIEYSLPLYQFSFNYSLKN